MKRLSVVLAVLFLVTSAFARKPVPIGVTSSGTLLIGQTSYPVGSSVPITYSYSGLPVDRDNYLLLQTICWGEWNGQVFDTATQFFQSDTIQYSSASGGGVVTATIPATYVGSGGCNVTLYLMYKVASTNYSKTLATGTFSVTDAVATRSTADAGAAGVANPSPASFFAPVPHPSPSFGEGE